MARKISVEIVGDSSSLQRAFNQSNKAGSSWGRKMGQVGKMAGLGLAAGVGLAAVALKKSYDAALDAERAQGRLDAAFKTANVSARERTAAMSSVSRISRQAALDDEALMDSLGRLTRITGDVTSAQSSLAVAADLARARGIDLEAATQIVSKAHLGQLGALKRIGIEIPKVTAAQDALKASGDKVSASQLAAAKAADEVATRQSAVAKLQQQYAGASEAYGRTAAGAQERFQVAVENLQEALGAKLLPVVTRVFDWLVVNMPTFERIAKQTMEAVGAAIDFVAPAVMGLIRVIGMLAEAAQRYWPQVQRAAETVVVWYRSSLLPAIQNVVAVISAIWERFGEHITLVIRTAFTIVRTFIATTLGNISSVVQAFLAILRGDWSEAWNEIKEIPGRTLRAAATIIKGLVGVFLSAARTLGAAVKDGILAGVGAVGAWFGAKLAELQGAISSAAAAAGAAAVRIGQAVVGGVLNGLGGLWNAVKSKVESTLSGVLNSINPFSPVEHGGEIYIGTPIVAGAVAGINRNAPQLPAALVAAIKRIVGLAPQFYDAGLTLGESLAAGLLDARGKVVDAANELAAAVARSLNVAVDLPKVAAGNAEARRDQIIGRIPGMAEGGIVNRPTLALIGEAGPEAVVPLSGTEMVGATVMNFNFPNYVGNQDELIATVREGLMRVGRYNAGGVLGGAA